MLYMHSKLAIQTDRLRMFACCAAVYLKRTVERVLARREKYPASGAVVAMLLSQRC